MFLSQQNARVTSRLTASRAEDWAAAYRFIQAHIKQPVRELVIGADFPTAEPTLFSPALAAPLLVLSPPLVA